jgi:hypothetical protein
MNKASTVWDGNRYNTSMVVGKRGGGGGGAGELAEASKIGGGIATEEETGVDQTA